MFTSDDIRTAIQAEEFRELASSMIYMPNGQTIVPQDFSVPYYLDSLTRLGKALSLESKAITYVRGRSGNNAGRSVTRLTKLGADLYQATRQYRSTLFTRHDDEWVPRFGPRRFNPHIEACMQAFERVMDQLPLCQSDPELLGQVMTSLAADIRSHCRTRAFKAKISNYSRNANQNLKRFLTDLKELFRRYTRLMVLRVDLYVRTPDRDWSYSAEADAALDKLVRWLREGFVKDGILHRASAREDGVERGQHYHLLIVLDGNKHHAGASLAQMVGEYWVDHCIPKGKAGSYFNCFALMKKYKYLGIGMVHCRDALKLLGLFFAVSYLFKDSVQLIATGQDGRKRNFRKGQPRILKSPDANRRGAPRQHDDNLEMVEHVFFGEWSHADEVTRMIT